MKHSPKLYFNKAGNKLENYTQTEQTLAFYSSGCYATPLFRIERFDSESNREIRFDSESRDSIRLRKRCQRCPRDTLRVSLAVSRASLASLPSLSGQGDLSGCYRETRVARDSLLRKKTEGFRYKALKI